MTTELSRRSALAAVKLTALVREHAGAGAQPPEVVGGGAALVHAGAAYLLADERPERALGPALAWGRSRGASEIHVLAERATGLLARRAAEFADPPRIWQVTGRSLVAAVVEPLPDPVPVDERVLALRAVIAASGAEPVVEHGVLAGEVAGLEVCRAVVDPYLGVGRLEVGVGAHDRESFQLLHGDAAPMDALAAVVTRVAAARRAGAEPHPLGRLGQERALRSRLVVDPGVVGAASLVAVPPPVPRANLKDPVPCVATGTGLDGEPLVVVCSVGIDLDVVPFAADARLATMPLARLLIAVPRRDAHPVTIALAARLRLPATVACVD